MESNDIAWDIGAFIILAIALAEFIALVFSMFSYFDILHGIETNPMNTQNFIDIGKWIYDFILGQVVGWPISLIITFFAYLLMGGGSSKI